MELSPVHCQVWTNPFPLSGPPERSLSVKMSDNVHQSLKHHLCVCLYYEDNYSRVSFETMNTWLPATKKDVSLVWYS